MQAEWRPIFFNCWEDHLGTKWVLADSSVSPDLVAAKVTQSFFDNSLVAAAQHFNAKGIQDGIDVNNTLSHIRNQKPNHQSAYQYAAALETVGRSMLASQQNPCSETCSPELVLQMQRI